MRKLFFIMLILFVSTGLNAEEYTLVDEYTSGGEMANLQSEDSSNELEAEGNLKKKEQAAEEISAVAKIKSKLNKETGMAEQKSWKLKKSEAPSMSVLGGNMLKGLAFCLGIIFITLSILKRFKFGKTNIPRTCKVLETLKLTDKSKLLLVEIEGKKIALSVGSERVSSIHAFDAEDNKLKIQNKTEKNIINEQGLELLCQ